MSIRQTGLFIALLIFSFVSYGQTGLWQRADLGAAQGYINANSQRLPGAYKLFRLDGSQSNRLRQAAGTGKPTPAALQASGKFQIPLPDGSLVSGILFESTILSPELSSANPLLKTYILVNPATHNTMARLTISPAGVSGIIFTINGTAYIHPLGSNYPDLHLVYLVRDLKNDNPINCGVQETMSNLRETSALATDGLIRNYRLAVAATGEYTVWAGGQSAALSYITTAVNDINAIYETDLGIHLTLVTNNSVLFTDPSTDPYPTIAFPNSAMLSTNHSQLTTLLGSGNFDLGIVFNDGWNGGLANVGVVCNSANKGGAAAGISFGGGANPTAGPQGPIFEGTVAHELAHLFNATHTFASTNGSCSGQAAAATAYEPGGGSTLMAYAGSCTGNSYQNYTDHYFHAGSLAQIQSYIAGGGASCTTPVSTGNNPPTVTVPAASYTIPASTPFALSAAGSDPDGNILSYTWEQMNAGTTTTLSPQSTNTSGPNFRSYPPSSSADRTFQSMIDLLLGNATPYEVFSSVSRTLNFRVTARDNAAGGGATASSNVAVVVAGGAGPFTVTSQSSPVTWTADGSSTAAITWNVANTTAAPVNCASVDILFSTDGGYTYPYTLLSGTNNDGTETITVPNIPTSSGRIKIQGTNNIFFNMNTANITIASACAASGVTYSPSADLTATAGSPSLNLSLAPQFGSPVIPSGQITGSDPATVLVVRDSTSGGAVAFGNTFRYDSFRFVVNVSGTYTFSNISPFGLVADIYAYAYDPANPSRAFMASSGLFGNKTSLVYLSSSMPVSLSAGTTYILAVGTFSSSQPTLPASYNITVSGPPGGNLYAGTPDPGSGFSYTYVIVDKTTGLVKAIDAGSDLSNSSVYPSGHYSVYGLSYSNSVPASTLNSYIGQSFSVLSNDLLNKPSTICGSLSLNSLTATINAALPVTMLPLRANKLDSRTVRLQWATVSEFNNDHFEIQRSPDGANFASVLGTLKGSNYSNSLLNYSFDDKQPLPGWNYYRVKQVDKDGHSSLSNVAAVNFAEKSLTVNIYPSPAHATLYAEYYAENGEAIKWQLIDGRGAVVQQGSLQLPAGNSLHQINVGGLSAGTYLLRSIGSSKVTNARFIKD